MASSWPDGVKKRRWVGREPECELHNQNKKMIIITSPDYCTVSTTGARARMSCVPGASFELATSRL